MFNVKSRWIFLLFVSGLVFLAGCKEKNPYGTAKVKGTILVDGVPMADVHVNFIPQEAAGNSAGGITNAKGEYDLTTGGAPAGSGAIPGKYNVLFYKQEIEGANLSLDEQQKLIGNRQPKITHIIPESYNNPKTSGIEPVTVEAGTVNTFDFQLSTKK